MPNILRNASGDLIAKRTLQRSPTYLNVSKNILARQSIFRNLDCNIDHKIKKAPSILTQQQIKQSSIYEKLMLRIQRARQRQQQQKIQHQRRMKQLEEQIRETKQSIKQDKLDIWEVRNETLELEEMFQQQMQEYEYLCHVLQEQMQHHGLHQFMGGEEYNGQGQGEGYYDQQDEQEEAYQTNQDMQQGSTNRDPPSQQRDSFSKPTCSIKFMITERSITTPDLSNIQIHSGRQPFSNHTHENYTHNCMHQQNQQELKNKRILSFKKSSHIFTHQG